MNTINYTGESSEEEVYVSDVDSSRLNMGIRPNDKASENDDEDDQQASHITTQVTEFGVKKESQTQELNYSDSFVSGYDEYSSSSEYSQDDYDDEDGNDDEYGNIVDIEREKLNKKDLSEISSEFFKTSKRNILRPTKSHRHIIPKDVKKYWDILNDANIDFITDLPLHLYNTYLLSTRNKDLPPAKFTLWPLPTNDLITPKSFLRTTNFKTLGYDANHGDDKFDDTRYTYVNYDENSKRSMSFSYMWEFWHPKINPSDELHECLDSIYEKHITNQIREYANSYESTRGDHVPNKYTYDRESPDDIELNSLLKKKVMTKLDSIIDRLTDYHTTSIKKIEKISRKLGTVHGEIPRRVGPVHYGLDWLSVLSCLQDNKKDKKAMLLLLRMFNLRLDSDLLTGPIASYRLENKRFRKAKIIRDKKLKNLVVKTKKPKRNTDKSVFTKIANKQRTNIRYNLGEFINMELQHTKERRAKEMEEIIGKQNGEDGENGQDVNSMGNAEEEDIDDAGDQIDTVSVIETVDR